jgi:hypothetical protein
MPKNLIVKNIPFDRVRAVITASQSSTPYTYYSEGDGNRFYVNAISSTASPVMEAATFNSFLSFTMSGFATFSFDLIPMSTGNSAIIETTIYAQNTAGTKGFAQTTFGAFRHSGSALTAVGGSVNNTTKTDFTSVSATWTAAGTQSIRLTCVGQTSETLDWDVHISYKKGFHTILTGTQSIPPLRPIYPDM